MVEKKKILIAEDEKFLSTALADKLEREGFAVIKVTNGTDAVAVAKAEVPDLLLLDLIMPQKNGFEVLEELKGSVPTIILSNLGQDSDIEKAKKLGARDYWIKSEMELKVIAARVKEFLRVND